jgi:hypothetical protein
LLVALLAFSVGFRFILFLLGSRSREGITGYANGAAFYIFVTLLTSLLLARKSNFQYQLYFVDKKGPLLEGIFKGVMVCFCLTFFS